MTLLTASLTAADLTAVLQVNGHLPAGSVQLVKVEPSHSYGQTSERFLLDVTYDRDVPRDLPARFFLKIGEPDWFETVKVEVDFYRTYHMGWAVNLPKCYAADYAEDGRQSYLLFEDLSKTHWAGDHPHVSLSMDQISNLMRALGTLHGTWWQDARLRDPPFDWFLEKRHFDGLSIAVQGQQQGFITTFGEKLSKDELDILDRDLSPLFSRYRDRVLEVGIQTLEHGDVQPANIMFDKRTDEVVILDWQGLRLGSGMNDVTLPMLNSLSRYTRFNDERPLVQTYHEALTAHGAPDYSFDACWNEYRFGMATQIINPAQVWVRGFPETIIMAMVRRVCAAFEELDCEEFV